MSSRSLSTRPSPNRTCHLISASTFDKMCADMKAQHDDMTDDLHPHGVDKVTYEMWKAAPYSRERYQTS